MATPLFYSDEVETIPSDQAENIEQILEILGKLLKRRFEVTGHYRRDVHVKSHGCVRGEFRVLENLPADLSQGLFARPGAYTAFVRFSNSAPWVQPDVVPDGRGLAIQVEGVS